MFTYIKVELNVTENVILKRSSKIGPEGISVSDASTRTTSSLEAYNGEEFTKSRDFEQFANSGGSFGKIKRRKTNIDRSTKIKKAVDELKKGVITASTFLNRMVFPQNQTCTEMEPEEDMFEDIIYLEEEIDEDDMETSKEASKHEIKFCVVCITEDPNILCLPCKHLKICNGCALKLQAQAISDNEEFNCPVCRQPVAETMQVFLFLKVNERNPLTSSDNLYKLSSTRTQLMCQKKKLLKKNGKSF
ncbi:uncharacterized protein LOC135958543 [Calliphora vicina]|uniref:uncharacterized protein LOC135958543 n=1 Tax=Calliphora vicina TaxID=7373 RepID=UPI00325B10F2